VRALEQNYNNKSNDRSGRALVLLPQNKSIEELNRRSDLAQLTEAKGLAEAIGLDVVEATVIAINRPKPSTLLGSGKTKEIGRIIRTEEISVVILNIELTPVQQRNLERSWQCKVIDRTGLILEIFASRARTKEGRLQVDLARLTYQRSRLVRSWTHLERQRGGIGTVGGPGETQIEADRRAIDNRMVGLRKQIDAVVRTRKLHRKARTKVPFPIVALVGYTNAGKSTLFNRLTGANVVVKNRLFETLDPTMRAVNIPARSGAIILSDTVGFVSALPTQLVAAFRATLEEVVGADLIVHVRDIIHPDNNAQKLDVLDVLANLGMDDIQRGNIIEVYNKIDQADKDLRLRLANLVDRNPLAVNVSALSGEGLDKLLTLISSRLIQNHRLVQLKLPHSDGATLAWLHQVGEIIDRIDEHDYVHLEVSLDAVEIGRLEKRLGRSIVIGHSSLKAAE